uniref:Uncharacterized protein n=1 Tax=Arundo donax TaxID=35708 RepID=A0A0A9AS79_ARUDO
MTEAKPRSKTLQNLQKEQSRSTIKCRWSSHCRNESSSCIFMHFYIPEKRILKWQYGCGTSETKDVRLLFEKMQRLVNTHIS